MFQKLRDSLKQFLTPAKPLPSGTFHIQAPPDTDHPYRLHLRMEPDGRGLLIVNAKTVLHLNPTAAEFAYHMIQDTPADEVANQVSHRYRVSRDQARADYQSLAERIQSLTQTEDLDPVTYLDFERTEPYSTELSAPYRLDCALTYRLREDDDTSNAPNDRVTKDLSTEEWKHALNKAWEAGIPHVVFTGGEPTLRPDLPDLISHAQTLGQVSGLLTDGLHLTDPSYFNTLLQTGLDHIMIVLRPEKEASWEAVQAGLADDIFVTVHLTIELDNKDQTSGYLDRLAAMGVKTISLSAADPSLAQEILAARKHAAELQLSLVWDLPVPYSHLHPVALEKDEDALDGAGTAWLYVEPDGDVLPGQGINQVLGNLLRDPWNVIWANRSLRLPPAPEK